MLGRNFKPGVIYADGGDWLLVKTRGHVITQGVDGPIVRMTAADRDGTVRRTWVYAQRRYQTVSTLPAEGDRLSTSVHSTPDSNPHLRLQSGTYVKTQTEPAARRRPKPQVVPAAPTLARAEPARRMNPRPRTPQIKIATAPSPFLDEACYWLPPDMNGLRPAQNAIVEMLSELRWVDACEVRRSSDGVLVEHDGPQGMNISEMVAHLHHTQLPSQRHAEAVLKALEPLLARGIVEQSPADRRRYRLRGWQCLHSRRRTTRRAIEHGGGRAVYATVRFSA